MDNKEIQQIINTSLNDLRQLLLPFPQQLSPEEPALVYNIEILKENFATVYSEQNWWHYGQNEQRPCCKPDDRFFILDVDVGTTLDEHRQIDVGTTLAEHESFNIIPDLLAKYALDLRAVVNAYKEWVRSSYSQEKIRSLHTALDQLSSTALEISRKTGLFTDVCATTAMVVKGIISFALNLTILLPLVVYTNSLEEYRSQRQKNASFSMAAFGIFFTAILSPFTETIKDANRAHQWVTNQAVHNGFFSASARMKNATEKMREDIRARAQQSMQYSV